MTSSANVLPDSPLVSVCIITYRHARYIRQCVESALAQVADFPYEILIGEDESDDGTREICQELAAAHPGRIRLVLNRRADVVYVDGRPRGTNNLVATVGVAQGEFVALCEGDDFWTDPSKLSRQVAYLRANPDCVGCFHEASLVDGEDRELQAEFFKPQVAEAKEKYDRRDCIADLLSKYATCSLMYRRTAFRDPPQWYLRRSCDFFFDLVITAHGKLGFIDQRMAAYRRHGGGVWSGQTRVMQFLELITRFRLLLSEPEFFPIFREELLTKLKSFECALALTDELGAAHRELEMERQRVSELLREKDQLVVNVRRLLDEREKLLAFLKKQHELIQSSAIATPLPR